MVAKSPGTLCSFQGSYEFLKVMEIDKAIFEDLESFGREVFENGYGKFMDISLRKF